MKVRTSKMWVMGVVALVVGSLLAAGCSGGGTLTIGGSSTVQPLTEAWADEYMDANQDVEISVQGGGSSAGVKGAIDGTLDIGAASRALKPEEEEIDGVTVHRVAADGVAIVVHPSRDIGDLSLAEVADIFAGGNTDDWTVANREEGSGTREVFETLVMDGVEVGSEAEFLPSNGAIKEKVASTENAIGYISLGYVDSSVKPVTIDGVEATVDNVLNGSYPVMRYLIYITMGEPEGLAADFIDYALSSEGQSIVSGEGYIPL
ncbi:MAG: phosphate ABC transporter substrate-binding protein [Chloroflexota bacterium]